MTSQASSSAIPESTTPFGGAWRRRSLRLGDGQPFEDSDVLWLQVGAFFADMRTPLAGAAARSLAFSGRARWAAPFMTFARDLDLDVPPMQDRGRLTIQGDLLIEQGVFARQGTEVPYEETWTRAPERPDRPQIVLDAVRPQFAPELGGRRYVETDGHAVVILDDRPIGGTFKAAHFTKRDGDWRRARIVGDAQELGPPPLASSMPHGGHLSFPKGAGPWSETAWIVRYSNACRPSESGS